MKRRKQTPELRLAFKLLRHHSSWTIYTTLSSVDAQLGTAIPSSSPSLPNMPVYAYDIDPNVTATPPINFSASPPIVLLLDLIVILKHIALLPVVFSPFPRPGVDLTTGGILLQIIAFISSVFVTGMWIASLLLGVPAPWIAMGIGYAVVTGIQLMQGKTVIPPTGGKEGFEDEAWFV